MKLKSSVKVTKSYNIDDVVNDKCVVAFIDLTSEVIETHTYEEGTVTEYIYDVYRIELAHDEEYINENYVELLSLAKDFEYNQVAQEVRDKRRKLLEETDNECLSDRNPSEAMIEYRQALRDIPEQEGFPYNVIWPVKP